MCDYSLCGLPNRLAAEGEELVVHKFRTGSMGLISPADLLPPKQPQPARPQLSFWDRVKSWFELDRDWPPVTAVCVPPGAQLILKNLPAALQQRYGLAEEEGAFFVQTSANPNTYRDAVRFCNGAQLLLQSFPEGIRIEVLSLGATADEDQRLAVPVR